MILKVMAITALFVNKKMDSEKSISLSGMPPHMCRTTIHLQLQTQSCSAATTDRQCYIPLGNSLLLTLSVPLEKAVAEGRPCLFMQDRTKK